MNINTTHVLKDDEFYEVHSVECYDADIVEKYIQSYCVSVFINAK